jgi:hypothetical protein
MTRVSRALIAAVLSLGLAVPLGVVPAGATAPGSPVRLTRLVDIRAVHRGGGGGVDRVVFEFDRGLPRPTTARYVRSLTRGQSGLPLRVPGRALLRVTMRNADGHDSHGLLVPRRAAYALPNVMTVVLSEDFEGFVTFGIGLAAHRPFSLTVRRHPSRVVLEVGTRFARVPKRVSFLDQPSFAAGHRPYVRAVRRPVPTKNPAVGLMDRLFAGPTVSERHDGLRLVRSSAQGFTRLRIAHGIARVQLTGGCSSRGSTFTVADEIIPTLRRLRTVDFVKVYDPAGQTQAPAGRTNSIPTCLEP